MIGAKRNLECRCGSGKKYKNCCYEKDNKKRLKGSTYHENSWKQRRIDKKIRKEENAKRRELFKNPFVLRRNKV